MCLPEMAKCPCSLNSPSLVDNRVGFLWWLLGGTRVINDPRPARQHSIRPKVFLPRQQRRLPPLSSKYLRLCLQARVYHPHRNSRPPPPTMSAPITTGCCQRSTSEANVDGGSILSKSCALTCVCTRNALSRPWFFLLPKIGSRTPTKRILPSGSAIGSTTAQPIRLSCSTINLASRSTSPRPTGRNCHHQQ